MNKRNAANSRIGLLVGLVCVSPFCSGNLQHLGIHRGIDISPASYKYWLKTIHTQEVYNTIAKQSPNPVLGFPAPKINIEESELPKSTPTILADLAQHRSEYAILSDDIT